MWVPFHFLFLTVLVGGVVVVGGGKVGGVGVCGDGIVGVVGAHFGGGDEGGC